MRIYFFRDSQKIDIEGVKRISHHVSKIIGVTCVMEENCIEDIRSLKELQEMRDRDLLKKKSFVGILFTLRNIEERALGVASCRVAIVRYNPKDLRESTLAVLHEVGHLCETGHCNNKYCLMYPVYTGLPIEGVKFAELLCDRCRRSVSHSWVYKLMTEGG